MELGESISVDPRVPEPTISRRPPSTPRGLLATQTAPRFLDGSRPVTVFTYDARGRQTQAAYPTERTSERPTPRIASRFTDQRNK